MKIFQVFLLFSALLFINIVGWLREADQSHAAGPPARPILCDLENFNRVEADFQRMTAIRATNPAVFSAEEYKIAALNYISLAESCYRATIPLNGTADVYAQTGPVMIDQDGEWAPGFAPPPGSEAFNTYGTKWGAGSPYSPNGQNQSGPGLAGGMVTYSYMQAGVSHATEGAGSNVDVRTGLGVGACVETEVANAFAAWSAVADIQFVRVADNNVASDGFGAVGDIRIGAHPLDGPAGTLAHAFFPPPNSISIAGDIHFDSSESWSCTTAGGFDIGLVVLHEIGHSIGLRHEPLPGSGGNLAVMNPFYPVPASLQLDDVNGAASIYGAGHPLTLDHSLLNNPADVTSSAILTYQLTLQNLSSQSISDVTVSDTIPADTTYVPNSAVADPPIVNLTNFPTNTPPFTMNGLSTLKITYNLQVGAVNQGDLLINTGIADAPALPQPVQKVHTAIVEPYLYYLPVILQPIW
jgi:uncharacterized repeat protein (TIGR01451 family)